MGWIGTSSSDYYLTGGYGVYDALEGNDVVFDSGGGAVMYGGEGSDILKGFTDTATRLCISL
jgi:Ca2+-binding RTX toxin-like protein